MAFLEHTVGILTKPDEEWAAIRKEKRTFQQVFLSHIPFLALIPTIAFYFGVTQVGWSIGGGEKVRLSAQSAFSLTAISYIAMLAGVYIFGEFINWMARTYGVKGDEKKKHYAGTALAVYAVIPMMLAGVVLVYPSVWVVALVFTLFGAWSVYLIFHGTPIIMNIDKDRAFMYSCSIVTIGLVLLVSTRIASVIFWGMGIGPVYVD